MKKMVIWLGSLLILSGCQSIKSPTETKQQVVVPSPSHAITTISPTAPNASDNFDYDPSHPVTTVDKAVDIMMARLSPDDLNYLKNSTEADKYWLHFGLGMGIRNSFGLWKGNEALLKDACGGQICHPDDASSVIIERLLKKVKQLNLK